MEIGIIGTGQIGGTLARKLTALGHNVLIANSRGPASLAGLPRSMRLTIASGSRSIRSACRITLPRCVRRSPV